MFPKCFGFVEELDFGFLFVEKRTEISCFCPYSFLYFLWTIMVAILLGGKRLLD